MRDTEATRRARRAPNGGRTRTADGGRTRIPGRGRVQGPASEPEPEGTRRRPGPRRRTETTPQARQAFTRGLLRTVHVRAGGWRTLEHFWNAQGTAFFRLPVDAEIKVRYGAGWFGFDTQEQTLDGSNYKKLEVGPGSLVRARMQMKVPRDTNVTYEVHGGGVAVDFPEQRF